MDALEGLALNFSAQEKKEAKELEEKIRSITEVIKNEKLSLESNFVRLSQYIDEVRSKKYWLLGNFRTFGDYLLDCEKRFGIGKSQLYVGMGIARNLLPSVTEKDLINIGITKAGRLSKYVEQSGQTTIPEEVLQVARDPKKTSGDLDELVNSKLHNVPNERGKWINLGGFFVTEDERKEIEESIEIAKGIDPTIPNTIPEWMQIKEVILRWQREFRSSWG